MREAGWGKGEPEQGCGLRLQPDPVELVETRPWPACDALGQSLAAGGASVPRSCQPGQFSREAGAVSLHSQVSQQPPPLTPLQVGSPQATSKVPAHRLASASSPPSAWEAQGPCLQRSTKGPEEQVTKEQQSQGQTLGQVPLPLEQGLLAGGGHRLAPAPGISCWLWYVCEWVFGERKPTSAMESQRQGN